MRGLKQSVAHYVAAASGGRGAVREICELLLKARGLWEDLLRNYEISPHFLIRGRRSWSVPFIPRQ